MKVKVGDLVEVEWLDIVSKSSWMPISEAKEFKPAKCKSVGYLISRGDAVRIAYSMSEDGDCSVEVIPKGCVVRITKLLKG